MKEDKLRARGERKHHREKDGCREVREVVPGRRQ